VAPPTEEEVVEPGIEMVPNAVGKMVEKPRYGGMFRQGWATSPLYFDGALGLFYFATTLWQTNEPLVQGDWAKGPGGTGEASWLYNAMPAKSVEMGCLAESWEINEPGRFTFNIRKGIHFHDKPPTNGRELDAHDVAYSLNRLWESRRSTHHISYPWETHFGETGGITATDKWTVVVKTVPGRTEPLSALISTHAMIVPHEVVDEYGDLAEWENSCGTGPFMLVDYVKDSSAAFVRNPNYWMKDPLHPDNQLPYADGLKYMIIPDASTRLAALRTGKIDQLLIASQEDAESLLKTSPTLKFIEFVNGGPLGIFWRVDKPELPFYDKRVRRALYMAINNQEIKDYFYSGHAEILAWPILPAAEWSDIYTPLEELPESSRELYEYHPDKARQLLAEAGYPDGFKTEVVCHSTQVDLLSLIKAYWEDVGVDLQISVKELGAYIGIGLNKKYDIYVGGLAPSMPYRFTRLRPPPYEYNYSVVDDPHINEVYQEITESYLDLPKRANLMRDISKYIIDQAYVLQPPTPNLYNFWQPWIKSYHGEIEVGYLGSIYNFPKYVWIDQDLREERTGAR